jgi:hypothetical protein
MYELIDTEVGDVVARASKVGVSGRDHYPWDWYLMDDTVEFGSSGLRLQGSTETLQGAIDFIEANANRYGLTYKRELRDRDAKREQAIADAKAQLEQVWEDGPRVDKREIEGMFAAPKESALAAMVRKIDNRIPGYAGYVGQRDELIAILKEVSPLVSVSFVKDSFYNNNPGEISVTIKLGLTLERKLL